MVTSKGRSGAAKLAAWAKANGHTQRALAALFGVSQSAVSRWLSGGLVPDGPSQELIEVVTGVPRSSWWTREERRRIAAAARDGHGSVSDTEAA